LAENFSTKQLIGANANVRDEQVHYSNYGNLTWMPSRFCGLPVWTTRDVDDLLAVLPVVIGHEEDPPKITCEKSNS
jgi:hypothetical protein